MRFRLSTLLIVTAVACCSIAFLSHRLMPKDVSAIRCIVDAGGSTYLYGNHPKVEKAYPNTMYTICSGLDDVVAIPLQVTETPMQLSEIITGPPVKSLSVVRLPVDRFTPQIIEELKNCKQLTQVVVEMPDLVCDAESEATKRFHSLQNSLGEEIVTGSSAR